MQFGSVETGDLIFELRKAKDEGIENIQIDENRLISTNLGEFYQILEEAQFRRIKMQVSGLLLSDYNIAVELIRRGVRIFEAEFNHHDHEKHDELAGKGSYKLILQAIASAYQASIYIDVPAIFHFTLNFDETYELAEGIRVLSGLNPTHFRIVGYAPVEHLRAAIRAGNENSRWVELGNKVDDEELAKRVVL